MPKQIRCSIPFKSKPIPRWIALVLVAAAAQSSRAEDWNTYALIPVSAPMLALEAVDSAASPGTLVSIGKAAAAPNQKWTITPKGNNLYAIKPSYDSALVLAVAKGGAETGTAVVLETDSGQPWQEWALKKNSNGSYCLVPQHAQDKGLDHLAGKAEPGAKIDLWTSTPGDAHLQWIVKPLAGTLGPLTNEAGEAPPNSYVPPQIAAEDILKGQVKNFAFTSSAIFPGTGRQVTVFIPAQYDGSKPACVYVRTDGFNPKEQELLETLIATKEMPVTVGVFVTPGNLPATVKNTLGRRNRCFEYDGVGDENVRFIVDEVLPSVASKFGLKLSTDGNDRCIAGISSGGIAAFNAAWQRPEAFGRVYANSGSFVAFRGGHEFPTLIRKFEAKPIRAFLTTGTHDMENCAGDWFLLDQEMDKALKFSGYDYKFRIVNGGHGAGFYENFQEAMSYLWKDWPQPVKAGGSAPRVRDILLPDETWQPMASDRRDARGPALGPSGEVFFVDTADNKIFRIDLDGGVKEFISDAGGANSLTVGADGQLYAASKQTGKIMRYDASGRGNLVAEGIRGDHLAATPGGGLYVTSNGEPGTNSGSIWLVKDGQKTQVDTGLKLATGLAFRADQWLLSVADGRSKWAYSYQIESDGRLTNKERFYWFHVPDWEDDAGAGSICHAKEGPLLAATRWGIQVCADDGPTQVILPLPDRGRPLGVCLAGREGDTLFAFCGDKIWKRKVKFHGVGAFSPWTATGASKL